MSFVYPWTFLAGTCVALVAAWGLWRQERRRRRLADFLGGRRATRRLAATDLHRSRLERTLLLALAAVCLAAAAAGPRWTSGSGPAVPTEGDDPPGSVVLVLDISASMQAVDVEPTRLAQATRIAEDLLDGLEGQRVGLVLVAGTPYTLAPPTFDHRVVSYLLRGVVEDLVQIYDPGSLPAEGVAEALRILDPGMLARSDSLSALAPDSTVALGPRSVVLLGDGAAELPPANVSAVGRAAAEAGVRVHAVGIGTEEGGELSLPPGYRRKGTGDGIRGPRASRFRDELLRVAAEATGGAYAHADDPAAMGGLRRAVWNDVPPPPDPRGSGPSQEAPWWKEIDPAVLFTAVALAALLLDGIADARLPRPVVARLRRSP